MPKIDYDNLVFDNDRLTANDFFDFEKASGGMNLQAVIDLFKSGEINEETFTMHLREITAFLWIVVRQSHPGITFEEVCAEPLIPMFTGIGAANGTLTEPLTPLQGNKPAGRKRAPAKKVTAGA